MQLSAAPDRAPAWGDFNVHLWWCPTPPEASAPRQRRGRLDTLLRRVLARYVGGDPYALRFGREPRGRPFLLGERVPDFNLSDTVGGSVVAVAERGRVGVDLERTDRSLPHRRLAQRYYAEREIDALAQLPEPEARAAFLRLWTAKEASCKATGTGIYGQLDRWMFAIEGETPRLWGLPVEAGEPARWHHLRLTPATDYTAVLACQGWAPRELGFALDP
jgi:4'-phosphopantetheinyl transferase